MTASSCFWVLLLIGAWLPDMSQQAALADLDYYTAGVVEFHPLLLEDNLKGYVDIIKSVDAAPADIIVFPEMTLNDVNSATFVPSPEEQVAPCLSDPSSNHYQAFLVTISCVARSVAKYIVINVHEKQLCTDTPEDPRPCASSGLNDFNTNVVFDREGVVISRYRKVHLYGENRNSTYQPELSTFNTDFGVTFGHFICFDILFYTPAQQLIEEQGITDFVYPTMWFSQLPFLTAVQYQQGWAYAQNVNLLAAGASHPPVGSTGTGIFHGRKGTISSVMIHGAGERRIYVAQVPKFKETRSLQKQRPRRSVPKEKLSVTVSDFHMKRDFLENYETKILEMHENQAGNVTQEVCHGTFCCSFEAAWTLPVAPPQPSESSYYSYRMGAYNGWRMEEDVDDNYVRNCGIFACTGPTIEECGLLLSGETPPQPRVAFTHLAIEVTYPESREFLLVPDTVLDNLLPLEPAQFEWTQSTKEGYLHQVRFALREKLQISNLLTFAIYGNYYDEQCTFGAGTAVEDQQCGYKPGDNKAADLRVGAWFVVPFILLLGSILG